MIIIYLLAILLLIILSAFFSSSETAMTAISKAKVQKLIDHNNKSAKKINKLLANKEHLIGSILLGNNAVNILSSAIATLLFTQIFGNIAIIYATIVMTILILIFAEIIPKTYALRYSEKYALIISSPLYFFIKITKPISIIIYKISNFFILLISPRSRYKNISSHLDEIKSIINLNYKEGKILKSDKKMIESIIDFSAKNITYVAVYRKNIISIDISIGKDKIIQKALEYNFSNIPLYKNSKDNIILIIDVKKMKQLLIKYNNDFKKIKLPDITYKPNFTPSLNNIKDQLNYFKKNKLKFSLIIDEYSSLIGLVTMEDILKDILGEDISYDKKRASYEKITKIKDDFFKISGEVKINDLEYETGWNLYEGDEDCNIDKNTTISGFIMQKIERIPDDKEEIHIGNYNYLVLKKNKNKIIDLKIKYIKPNIIDEKI